MSAIFDMDDEPAAEGLSEERKKLLALQAPSTQRAMRKAWGCPTEEDKAWKPSEETRAIPLAKSMDEAVGWRAFTFNEVKNYNGMRLDRGQAIAEMRGDAPVSSVDEAKRERAINAFMEIKKTFLELLKSWGLATESTIERVRREAGIEK